MKKISLLTIIVFSFTVHAEQVGVKIDKVDSTQDTTISIQKGKPTVLKKKYQISEGDHEISGDKDVVLKSAELKWKQECKDWKTEFRNDNKENKIMTVSCGKMKCEKEGVESTCSSTAKYKIKTVIEE